MGDSIQQKYSALEDQIQNYKQNDSKLNSALLECNGNLQKAQEKITNLKKDKERLQAMAESAKGNMSDLQNEQRRQIQMLEMQILEGGDELKKIKRELSTAKAELDAVQKNA